NQGINGNTSLRYLEFREGAFDFQTSQQNQPNYPLRLEEKRKLFNTNQPKIKKRDEPITFMIINRVFYI
ncbi:hypothetical protein, partial [Lactococcus taiwanensis]|uniref:hypothetical protein n=1 Tax=Lactococcus taiwanensis TaxID=1151742 RepID=UPI0028AA7069